MAGEVWADGEGCGGCSGLEMVMEEELGSEGDFWVDLWVFLVLEGAQGRVGFWVVSVCILGWSEWECGRSPLSSGLLPSVSGCGLGSLGVGCGHRVWWHGGRG